MEYSVYDLIRILLKKWYIILLAMCVFGGLSVWTSRTSYNQAVENYEASTAETAGVDVDTGTLTASYQYSYELTDLAEYLEDVRQSAAFYQRLYRAMDETSEGDEALSTGLASLANAAYSSLTKETKDLLSDDRVLANVQTAMDAYKYTEPPKQDATGKINSSNASLDVSKHLNVEGSLPLNTIRLTVSGLAERPARQILEAYLENVKSVGLSDYSLQVSMTERENTYVPDTPLLAQSSEFAQTVMAEPENAPDLVRTVGTAAAYAFVLSCFLILVVTFVRDSRRAGEAGEDA